MPDIRAKSLNLAEFGAGGTYPDSVIILDDWIGSNSLTTVTTLPTEDIFFFGMFNRAEPSLVDFTPAELDSLHAWSMRGGRVIIGAHATFTNFGSFHPDVLNSRWGFDVAPGGYETLEPTQAGIASGVYDGPFGTITSAPEGGSIRGYFSVLPPGAVVLGVSSSGLPTMFLDCETRDIVFSDSDVFTVLGQASIGPDVQNDPDRLWANMIVFMHELGSADSLFCLCEPQPNAGLDSSVVLCLNAPEVDLLNLLGGDPDANGAWEDVEGLTFDGIFDPSTDEEGTFIYVVNGTPGCTSDESQLAVAISETTNASLSGQPLSCSLSTTLNTNGPWASSIWTASSGCAIVEVDSSTVAISAPAGGQFEVVLSVTDDHGCTGTDSIIVTLTTPVEVEVVTTPVSCHDSCDATATVETTGGNVLNGPTISWSQGMTGPYVLDLCPGDHWVVTADTNACVDTAFFTIEEPDAMSIDQISATMTTCSDSCDGTILLVEPEAVLFSVDGGMTFTSASLFTDLCPGVYQLAVVNDQGCLALANAQVSAPPEVIADFILSTTDTSGAGQQLLLTNYSMNAVAYDWQIGSWGSSTAEDPVILVPIDGLGPQQICLTAFDGNGCLDVACQNINILGPDVAELPNVFSPNGDGQNDVFAPLATFGRGWCQLHVLNRWGQVVFEGDASLGWNGRDDSTPCPEGTYFWTLGCHASLSGTNGAHGTVTLLR